jgi:hypothetical protein
MIKVNYELIPEMKISMEMYDDIWGNSQHTKITMKAPAQPFIVNWEETEELSFIVVWTWELWQLVAWLSKCEKSCYEIQQKQLNCAK